MYPYRPSTTLERFFAGVTEQTFQGQLGVVDPPLVDYLSELLTRFSRSDGVFRIRDVKGRTLVEVAEMLLEARERVGLARREIHRHVGDFILFWAGIYPDSLQRMRGEDTKDNLLSYWHEGKRAYSNAATIDCDPDKDTPGDILERLSDQFELCVYGLGEVRREWERRDGEIGPGPILFN